METGGSVFEFKLESSIFEVDGVVGFSGVFQEGFA
jgi:hypothetical protein